MEGKQVTFTFLSQEEMIEAGVLDMNQCVGVMEEAFKLMGQGDYLMGGPGGNDHGLKLWFPETARGPRMPVAGPDRRFMALVSYLGGDFHVCGTKWYGSNTANPAKHGLPRSVLLVIINDPDTGAPIAIMDGNLISAMRTGAVVGMGARYLAPPGAEVAGIVAAGVISKTCLMALKVGAPALRTVKVYDIDREKADAFSQELGPELGLEITAVDDLETAVRGSDVISTAASGTRHPYYPKEWFKPGAYFALSSEADLAEDLWLDGRIVADNWKMHVEWREDCQKSAKPLSDILIHNGLHQLIIDNRMSDDDVTELAPIVLGDVAARANEEQVVVLVTGGLGIEDTSWGMTIYKRAMELGLGQTLRLWDKPYWF